ncbi:MAG: UDP-N-acetylglucosamine transferase [Clostridiales bacterium 38_11]|nr:MAG: UDP-N-acetylglucosamine transferase [Clostridiales bacterium 38_11]
MKVLITGGGTGGHISPALAIADILKSMDDTTEIIYIGSGKSMESEIVPKFGLRFLSVKTGFINRKILSISNIITVYNNVIGLFQASRIIKKENPDLVIGTGGFVSGPVVLAGKLCGKKTMIHEQNAYPGITNKMLSRIADVVMISFLESEVYFKKAKKTVLVGNPLKKEIFKHSRIQCRSEYDIGEDIFFIYSFGGSGGQVSLNNAIIELIFSISEFNRIKLLHVTGKRLYERFSRELKEKKIDTLPPNVTIVDYMMDAPKALNACDLVIGSAGAITVSEITALGLPAILVPKAYTAENHQEKNARSIEKNGGAFVLTEDEISGDKLMEIIERLMNNKDLYATMKRNSHEMANLESEIKIQREIRDLISNG